MESHERHSAHRQEVMEQARVWFVRLRDEAATEADRRAFAAWLETSLLHRRAWQETERLWQRMDAVVPALRRQAAAPASAQAPAMPSRRAWMKQAAAAALAVGAGGAWLAASPAVFADHRTAVGERRTVALADGSLVELGAGSALSVAIGPTGRQLTLHRGQAFFQVAPDPARPFEVTAGNGRIRALGTAFDIRMAADRVHVAVTEHAVAVTAGAGDEMRLGEGQALQYGPQGIGTAAAAVDIASVSAWRRDRLFFQEAPLGEVVADLDRYRRGRIVILDDRLRALPVTGLFLAAGADAALQTIEATLPVRLTRLPGGLVVIRPH